MIKINDINGVKYCHYTNLDCARKIIADERIFLSKMDAMNDSSETELHANDMKAVFSTCFCHSEAKSIPMFYLYSGIDGKGCRLEFTAAKIKELLRNIEVYPVNKEMKCLKKRIPSEDFDVMFDWIHYIASDGFGYYRGRVCTNFTSFEEASNPESDIYNFIKNPVWRYENEFRIVIRMKKDCSYERVAIHIPCKEQERGISITCGPELSLSEVEAIREEFNEYGIQHIHSYSHEKIKIEMKLVSRNKNLLSKG